MDRVIALSILLPFLNTPHKSLDLLNMLMLIDMLHTVAVIPVALGTVAELQIGVLRIRFAADGALVDVSLFLIGAFGGLLEIYRLLGVLVLIAPLAVGQGFGKIGPEEDKEDDAQEQEETGVGGEGEGKGEAEGEKNKEEKDKAKKEKQ